MSIQAADQVNRAFTSLDFNEADTRFQVIDRVLEEVLGWPKSAIKLEKLISPGYADYFLLRPNGAPALILEAKRAGIYFEIPRNFNDGKLFRQVLVKSLLTAPDVKDALTQAHRYAAESGCQHAAISNGRQFVIFSVFQTGKSWRDLPAIVISDLSWFSECYTEAVGLLGYSSVMERNSLQLHFQRQSLNSRELFFPKEKITSFNQIVNANALAHPLRSIVRKYLGPLDADDAELIERCYVNQRAYDKSLKGIRTLILDNVSPFMQTYGIVETEDGERGGAFTKRIAKGLKKSPASDVIVLFGGKGSGKSTFLKRVLLHKPPQFLKKHSMPAIVDLLGAPKEKTEIREHIWSNLIVSLDIEGLLSGDRDALLHLFEDRWDIARKQDLFEIDEESEAYIASLNKLVAQWKSENRYVVKRLIGWHARHHRAVIIALDNTDQLDNELQDYAFSVAEEISREFSCLVLISMREERFYASKMRGMLDAYQNSAFHISSPSPIEVFDKRISYIGHLIRKRAIRLEGADERDVLRFLQIFLVDFSRQPPSPLNKIIAACAHGNIRLALDLFHELLLSGYTNAREMIEIVGTWTLQVHQVLRPLMTPTRQFFDENQSRIPNLFQIRTPDMGSHFTGLRILRALSNGQDPLLPAYIPMDQLRADLAQTFGNDDDVTAWLDRFLATNMVEASTRQDSFSEDIDALRITAFGIFALTELHKMFTYYELVATDCGIRDESVCNELVRLSNEEVRLFSEKKRLERVHKRIEKAKAFITYLEKEEAREAELYGLLETDSFSGAIKRAFSEEEPLIVRSAQKNANK